MRGRKRFIVNRIGDFGFMLGCFLLFKTLDSGFAALFAKADPWPAMRWDILVRSRSLACCFSRARAENQHKLPLYVGCQTRWKDRRR